MPRDPDPVVETRTVVQRICPAELLAAVPSKPVRPAGGALTGDAPTLDWIGMLSRWGDDLAGLLADSRAQCR